MAEGVEEHRVQRGAVAHRLADPEVGLSLGTEPQWAAAE
jgi:hypothetical protein